MDNSDIICIKIIYNFFRLLNTENIDEQIIETLYLNGYDNIMKILEIEPKNIKNIVKKGTANKLYKSIMQSVKNASLEDILVASNILSIERADIKILIDTFPDIFHNKFTNTELKQKIESIHVFSENTTKNILENIGFVYTFLNKLYKRISRYGPKQYTLHKPETFISFILKNLDKDWDWCELSANINISWEDIENNLNLPWVWGCVSQNLNITWKILKENINEDWDFSYLSRNQSLLKNIDKIVEYPDKNWDWEYLSEYVTPYVIEKFPKAKFDWFHICKNHRTTWDIIKKNLAKINRGKYKKKDNWQQISANPNITWDIIEANLYNPDMEWDWSYISQNPNITWDIVKANLKKPWNWHYLSCHPNITWDIIEDNLDKPWDWENEGVLDNPNLTLEIILANTDRLWNWAMKISKIVPWEIVQARPNENWDWGLDGLLSNPNVTIENIESMHDRFYKNYVYMSEKLTLDYVLRHPPSPNDNQYYFWIYSNPKLNWEMFLADKSPKTKFHWNGISANPNITWEIVSNNMDKPWNWIYLSRNEFLHDERLNKLFVETKTHEMMKNIKEELLDKTLIPKRILWYENLDSDHPFYGLTQNEINILYENSSNDMKKLFLD